MFMLQVACQWLAVLWLVLIALSTAKTDIEGRAGIEPKGYRGIVETFKVMILLTAVLAGAGCFDHLLGR